MLKVIAEHYIKPEYIETVLPLYKELLKSTKSEKDCISYDLYIDKNDHRHFIFIEEWPDEAALEQHTQTDHFTRLIPQIEQYHQETGRMTFMNQTVTPD